MPRLIGGSALMHGPALAGVFHWPDPLRSPTGGGEDYCRGGLLPFIKRSVRLGRTA